MHSLETYFATLRQIHDTGGGVVETSYYGALENLLNQVGDGLDPQVRAVPQLRDTGAGSPDFGLFTAGQFEAGLEGDPLPGQKPERGVVEVKSWRDEVLTVAASEQVARYGLHYGMVLARYWEQCWEGNAFFMTRFRSSASPEGVPCYWVTELSDDHFIVPDNACFPVWLRRLPQTIKANGSNGVLAGMGEAVVTANLSPLARAYLQHLKLPDPDQDAETAELLWLHALAIGFSPTYARENADGIGQDWPRIPLPAERDALLASAELGRQIAALLDIDRPVTGVTAGKIRPELRTVGAMCRVGGGSINPDDGELAMTVSWGYPGKGGVTMPGKGRIEPRPVEGSVTEPACDLYLNEVAYWANVPRSVWEFTIGGYQVVKKWLSYREKAVLGRDLRLEEALYVTDLIRRLAALAALQPALDTGYAAARDRTWKAAVARPT